MHIPKRLLIVFIALSGIYIGFGVVRLAWRIISEYRIRHKNDSPTFQVHRRSIWHDPGDSARLNFYFGPDGQKSIPVPPFRFLEEHESGSNPNVSVQDARKRNWRVKWGEEVRSENFAARLVWAAGYFAETNYFIPEGRIEGTYNLQRAHTVIDKAGRFRDARFQLDDQDVVKMFDENGWSWNDNQFVGTKQLAGLKILVMLTSNWDNKDMRDVARGSNTAIFYHKLRNGQIEARYLINDWGGTMGKWGDVMARSKWDSKGFLEQTPQFVRGVENGFVTFGYTGQRTADAAEGISIDDVRWLYQYLGRITDAQLKEGLRASGATDMEISDFSQAVRARINQLKKIAGDSKLPLADVIGWQKLIGVGIQRT